jgi:hypothetical protein
VHPTLGHLRGRITRSVHPGSRGRADVSVMLARSAQEGFGLAAIKPSPPWSGGWNSRLTSQPRWCQTKTRTESLPTQIWRWRESFYSSWRWSRLSLTFVTSKWPSDVTTPRLLLGPRRWLLMPLPPLPTGSSEDSPCANGPLGQPLRKSTTSQGTPTPWQMWHLDESKMSRPSHPLCLTLPRFSLTSTPDFPFLSLPRGTLCTPIPTTAPT